MPSTDFSTPLSCSIFPTCSGCSKMGDTAEIPQKSLLENWAKELSCPFEFYNSSPYGYRIRTKLPCRRIGSNVELGLFKRGTHDLVPMERCPLHTEAINAAMPILKSLIEKHGIEPFDERTARGDLRSVQITDNRKGELQLALSFFEKKRDLNPFIKDLLSKFERASIWINFHPNPTSNAIFGEEWEHRGGESDFWIRYGKEEFPFHPGSFLQSNPGLFEKLLSHLEEMIPAKSKILELFSGVGVIGSQLANKAKEVVLVEDNPLCKEMFYLFLKRSGYSNLLFRTHGAEDFDLSNSYDVLILDPPRKGLAKSLKAKILESCIPKIIYVSCGWESLMRDVKDLSPKYRVEGLKGYLLFPGTDQVEVVAELCMR